MSLAAIALLLHAAAPASAHGGSFGVSQVSAAPDDATNVWAVIEGWGVVWTSDAGATWRWVCEEALGEAPVLTVLARDHDAAGRARAWVGTRTGLRTLDESCEGGVVPGLPDASYVAAMAPVPGDPERVLVLATGPQGGVYACSDGGCVATGLVGEGMYPKSIVLDEAGVPWVTTVAADTLAATLWQAASDAPELAAWEARAHWPAGDVDPRVLDVRGPRVLLWERTRAEGDTPRLVRSGDGGASWTRVLAHGSWTDAPPGILRVGDTVVLGSAVGARTWRSRNDGLSWTDESLALPAVRCGIVTRDPAGGPDAPVLAWTCGDHLADGFDLGTSADLAAWSPVACLQDAAVPACASATCDPVAALYGEAGALGGEACDADTGTPEAARGCGCAAVEGPTRADGWGGAVLLGWVVGAGLASRRRAARNPARVAARPEEA